MPPLVPHLLLAFLLPALLHAAPNDIVLADFEAANYGTWKAEGDAFGDSPARGTLPGQMHVDGFAGKGLVNSFRNGDRGTGTLTSPEFKIERRYLSFLIGGGGFAGETCLNLMIDGTVAKSATGPNTKPGGSEHLDLQHWDVAAFAGKTARLQIVDRATGGWGHINVDQIVLTDIEPPRILHGASRDLVAGKRWLHFPVKGGAPKRKVDVLANGKVVRFFDIELAPGEPEWWAPLDISAWSGNKLTIRADKLPSNSRGLESIRQADEFDRGESLYREKLRPQFHFSAKRGWVNDPNGLVFYRGEYHLFFQHNPYGWNWGNMHWGHAVSRDLIHWEEFGEALYPDEMGPMFSGSAVVDWKNTSGFGTNGEPPVVLFYTAAGNPTTQCLAYSTDGRTFAKYERNPIIKEITSGNRDPKVIWHEPTQKWVMVLYVELPGKKHTVHFFTSPNLREWTQSSILEGGIDRDHYLFECPDFYELPVTGDPASKKWVISGANSEYAIGSFDGARFTPEASKLPGHRGRGFYAAQTFSDEPKNRRIQIGWGQMPSPGMPFNQIQLFPCEQKLISTPEGPRLTWEPVAELASLRKRTQSSGAFKLDPSTSNKLDGFEAELVELRADFEPSPDAVVAFKVRGVSVEYDAGKQELRVGDHRAPAPLQQGRQRLIILLDRTSLEIFASYGLTYVPMPVIPKTDDRRCSLSATTGSADVTELAVSELSPAWNQLR
jgi:fructan beta-fructosidase